MKKILIVEDDAQLQKILQEKLMEEGYAVSHATSVSEGIENVKKEKIDLILLDIMLPGGQNGFDFLEQIKHYPQGVGIPVIILTNLDTERGTALSIGAVDYIIKANNSIDDIVKKVRAHLISSPQ